MHGAHQPVEVEVAGDRHEREEPAPGRAAAEEREPEQETGGRGAQRPVGRPRHREQEPRQDSERHERPAPGVEELAAHEVPEHRLVPERVPLPGRLPAAVVDRRAVEEHRHDEEGGEQERAAGDPGEPPGDRPPAARARLQQRQQDEARRPDVAVERVAERGGGEQRPRPGGALLPAQRRGAAPERERKQRHRPELREEARAPPEVRAVLEPVEAGGGDERREGRRRRRRRAREPEPARAEPEAPGPGEEQEQLHRRVEAGQPALGPRRGGERRGKVRQRLVGVPERVAERPVGEPAVERRERRGPQRLARRRHRREVEGVVVERHRGHPRPRQQQPELEEGDRDEDGELQRSPPGARTAGRLRGLDAPDLHAGSLPLRHAPVALRQPARDPLKETAAGTRPPPLESTSLTLLPYRLTNRTVAVQLTVSSVPAGIPMPSKSPAE